METSLQVLTVQVVLQKKGEQIHSISQEASVLEAVEKMCSTKVGALLVVQANKPVGIISERDLMNRVVLNKKDPASLRVAEVMSSNLFTITPEEKLSAAMSLMTEKRIRHLPVVDGSGNLKGMVSIGDLVRTITSAQEEFINMLEDYITGKHMV